MTELPDDMIAEIFCGASPVAVWRKYLGLTQNELASRAGIMPGRLRLIEDLKRMRPGEDKKPARVIGIAPDALRAQRGLFRECDDLPDA